MGIVKEIFLYFLFKIILCAIVFVGFPSRVCKRDLSITLPIAFPQSAVILSNVLENVLDSPGGMFS